MFVSCGAAGAGRIGTLGKGQRQGVWPAEPRVSREVEARGKGFVRKSMVDGLTVKLGGRGGLLGQRAPGWIGS